MGYLPSLGTFTRRDPLGTKYQDGMNLYSFVRSNPVRYNDPLGEATSASAPGGSKSGQTNTGVNKLDKYGDLAKQGSNGIVTGGPGVSLEALRLTPEAEAFGKRAAEILYKECPLNTLEDYEEAARHMYWMALLASRHGQDEARYAGNAHEVTENASPDSQRDSANNNVGREIGARIPRLTVGPRNDPGGGLPLWTDEDVKRAEDEIQSQIKAAEQAVLDAIRAGRGTTLGGRMKCCPPKP